MPRFLRIGRSPLIAIAIVAAATAWMLSGERHTTSARASAAPSAEAAAEAGDALTRVQVRTSEAERITGEVRVHGRTEPARSATLRAETDGRVIAVGPERGARVKKGEVIARIDLRDRRALLAETEAEIAQREIEYDAARKLEARNYQSQTQVARAKAALEAARAAAARVSNEIANTVVHAPFDGILERRPVEIGEYMSKGTEVARVIEIDPLRIAGDVSQKERNLLAVGDEAHAELITGEQVSGRVTYISAESDAATRTFRVEVEVPNPDARLVAGVTTELVVPTESRLAHRMSPATLTLDGADRIGVKSVDADGIVEFHPVEIVRASADAVWVEGLPERVRVITIGHGFVHVGDRVAAHEATGTGTDEARR